MNISKGTDFRGRNFLYLHPAVAKKQIKEVDRYCTTYYVMQGSIYNLASCAMVDAVCKLKEQGMWKHEVKHTCGQALKEYEKWEKLMKIQLNKSYQMWLDISDYVAERLQGDIDKLRWSYNAYLMKHNVDKHEVDSYLLTANTMNSIADALFIKFLRESRQLAKVDLTQLFGRESSYKGIADSWMKGADILLRCHGCDINCTKDEMCNRAFQVIMNKVYECKLYDDASQYAIDLNSKLIEDFSIKM